MKSLTKNSLYNAVYTILSFLFPLVTSVYVARILLPEGVGKVAYVQSIASYFVMLASLGLPNYGLRSIAKVRNQRKEKNKLFTELIIINGIATALSLFIYLCAVVCIRSFRVQADLFIACGFLICLNFLNIDWFYQGEEEYAYIVVRSLAVKMLSLIALFLLVKNKEDYVAYAWISSIAVGGNYIFNVVHARKYVSLDLQDINIRQHITPIVIMAGGVLLSSIYGKIDITMLGVMSTETSTGLYIYGQKIIELVISVCTAITAVFMPRLSFYYEHNRDAFYDLIEKGIKILCFLTFPMAAGLFIVSPEVTEILFGIEFLGASLIVRIFCILIIIKGFGNLLCFQLVMCTGNERERLPAAFLGSLANAVINFFLIPVFAEAGAAIASVISELIVNGYQFIKMKKQLAIKIKMTAFVQASISTIIMVFVCIVIRNIRVGLYLSVAIMIGGGTLSYVAVNLLMKNEILVHFVDMVIRKKKGL